jgi:hypothetical protein
MVTGARAQTAGDESPRATSETSTEDAAEPTPPEEPAELEAEAEQELQRIPIFLEGTGPPPGFENLDRPQRTLVDVYYGGTSLAPALAVFSDTHFQFLDAGAVVREIPGLLYPDRVLAALAEPLEPHAELVCRRPGVPIGCGMLRPAVAGVIFDAQRFRVEIFVDRSLLRLAAVNQVERLPPPLAEWSGLATLGGSVSGSTKGDVFSDLRAETLIGYGPGHFRFVGDLQDGTEVRVDRMFGVIDWRDWEFTSGLFRSRSLRVLGESEFVGVRAATSLRTLTKVYLDRAYGSRLPIFLNRRSLVQIFREGRLLTSAIYDAGNVELDTSELPEGAYQVELRVQDPLSGDRREKRFFAKTSELPPVGTPSYIAEVGALRDLRDPSQALGVDGAGFARVGASLRRTDQLGFDGDIAWIDKDVVFTVGGLWLAPHLAVRAGPIITHRGAGGVSAIVSAEYGDYFTTVNFRGFWGDTGSTRVRTDYLDAIAIAGYRWRGVRFAFRADARRLASFAGTQYAVTPSITFPFMRRGWLRADVSLEYARSDRGNLLLLRFDLAEWFRDLFFSQSLGGGYRDTDQDGEGYREIDLRGEWNSGHRWPVYLRNQMQVSDRSGRTSVGFNGDLRGNRGAASAFAEQVWREGGDTQTLYGGLFSVGIVGDRHGIEVGGESAGTSAIVIDLGGEPKGALFEIYANDSRIGSARVGSPLILPLASYASYSVRIVAKHDQLADYDGNPRRITLYPGTSVRMRWQVKKIYVLLTAVVLPDGSPLADAFVQGAVGEAMTDASGFLQADVAPGAQLTLVPVEGNPCSVRVPEEPPDGEFIVLDQVICR